MPQNEKNEIRNNQLLYIGNKLSRRGKTPTSIETLGRLLEAEGFKVFKASSYNNQLLRLVDMLYSIIIHRREVKYILIDTYSTSAFWYAYISGRLARLLNLNYIPILHGGNLPQRLNTHPKMCKQLFRRAKVNIAPSLYLMNAFENKGYHNLKHIPNTIKLGNYVFKERSQIKPNLLWVRSFAEIYNPLLALKVLKELLTTYPQAKLSMVGPFKDDSINHCKAYADKHQLPVIFTGGLPKEDWLRYAEDFDIFLNTTNVDNTPVSVIEAMALGLPVVSTSVGGIPFLLDNEQDALLVQPNDVHQMSEAVARLLQHPKLAQNLSYAARKKVEHFDWQQVKHQWVEVLD